MHSLLAYVHESDIRVAARIFGWRPAGWVCAATVGATRLGDGWVWLATLLALLIGGDRFRRVAAAVVLAGLAASATFGALKRRYRRPRPCEWVAHPWSRVRPPDRFSFPSGHTINAFAISTVLAWQWPLLLPALLATAAAIGGSRVALGLHYVSDVVAGAILGVVLGGLVAAAVLA
jgi:undecaprenyl-diphosphatase